MVLAWPAAATAQALTTAQPPPPPPPSSAAAPDENQIVTFSADQVTYDSDTDVVTASGQVRMDREGNYLAADTVTWDRKSGQVYARGNVVMVTPQGDKLVGDNVQLTDTLKDGAVDNLMVVLESGGRVAARHGTRVNGVETFDNAIYTPCPVTTDTGAVTDTAVVPAAGRFVRDPGEFSTRRPS